MADLVTISQTIGAETSKAQQALAWLRDTFQVVDQASLDRAAELVKAAKARWKDLEAERVKITRPMLEAKNAVDDLFRPAKELYSEAETVLKGKIGAYHAQVEALRIATMQQSAAEYQAGGTPTLAIPEPATAKGVSVRHVWAFNIKAPDLVPREFCSPDPAKIKAAIWYADTPHKPPNDIPGVEFYLADQVTVRTGGK